MQQLEAADIFDEIAELLELKGANLFRIRAYERAALTLRNLAEELESRVKAGTLQQLPGVGKDLAEKIEEIVATGRLSYLEKLRKEVPAILLTLKGIPGIGPKTAKLLYDRFKIKSLKQLESLVKSGKLRILPGFKEKKEENILRGIALVKAGQKRLPLGAALALGEDLLEGLKGTSVQRIELAGSLRRRQETVGDIDLLATSRAPRRVMERFVALPLAARVQAHGQTKSSIRTQQGIQIDLRVVERDAFGAALIYFTGSKAHNIKIRSLAQRLGLTINEYGIFWAKSGKRVAGREESQVYQALGLSWIPPELREDLGEVEAARKGCLPKLVIRKDLIGSFHNHSDWSDGTLAIEKVAQAIKRQGYRYMLLSDHSKSLIIARGLSEDKLLKQISEVKRLNKKLKPFRILTGSEVDILSDGRLDYPDRILKELDVVIAAVHTAFKQPEAVMTHRIIKALENPYVNILAHPTGKLYGEREPYAVNLEKTYSVAAQTGTALEINCHTLRLDLNSIQAKQAKEAGVKLVLATDTHVLEQLDDIELGFAQARRAWLGPGDLLNTMTAEELLAWVGAKHARAKG